MSGPKVQLEWVNAPQQARSQRTLERILDAAEQLIADKGIEAVTVNEVAQRAGSSVGAFYARFGDKDSLLKSVFERFFQQASATLTSVFEPRLWDGVSPEQILQQAIAFAVRVVDQRAPLLAAMTLSAARDPSLSALGERLGLSIAEHVLIVFRANGVVPDHPRPQEAATFAVLMLLSSLESRAMFARNRTPLFSDEVVARELSRMILAYLDLRPLEERT